MLGIALLAVVLNGAPAAPVQAEAIAADLIRDACVATDLQREAFEALARERRWSQVRITQNSGAGRWDSAYRAGNVTVMLSYIPEVTSGDRSRASTCVVTPRNASPALESEIAALASEMGLNDDGPVTGLPGYVRSWSKLGSWTLSYAAADQRAAISLSRQIVISSP